MEKIKQLQKWVPELYLVTSVIFYWVFAENLLNPVALIFFAILAILFVWKKAMLGIVISVLFLIASLFMCLALVSELSEFPVFNQSAVVMLLVGGTWLGLNILFASIMLKKWVNQASLQLI